MTVLRVGRRHPHRTIQDALSTAQEGDTIIIARGRYEGALTITVPDITIKAEKRHAVTLSTLSDESDQNTVSIEAPAVTLSGFIIEGQREIEDEPEDGWRSAVWVYTTDALIVACELTGSSSFGLVTGGKNTKLQDCTVRTGLAAVMVLDDGACIAVEDCPQITSKETGIWLHGSSSSRITNTRVENCGHTGIYLESASSFLRAVEVTNCDDGGIICDWPASEEMQHYKYVALGKQGHFLTDLTVEGCQNNGLLVFPGVRVVVHNCSFKRNSDDGVFFQGPEDDENPQKTQEFQKRAAMCVKSIIEDCDISENQGFGVSSETANLVHLLGQNNFVPENGKGDLEGIIGPGWPSGRRMLVTVVALLAIFASALCFYPLLLVRYMSSPKESLVVGGLGESYCGAFPDEIIDQLEEVKLGDE